MYILINLDQSQYPLRSSSTLENLVGVRLEGMKHYKEIWHFPQQAG